MRGRNLEAILRAKCWIDSREWEKVDEEGSKIMLQYSKIGRTRDIIIIMVEGEE